MITRAELWNIAHGHVPAAVLGMACDLGLFDFLTVPRTAKEVARHYGFVPWKAAVLLRGLTAFALIREKPEATYVLSDDAAAFLTSDSPDSLTSTLRLRHRLLPIWTRTADVLRSADLVHGQQSFEEEPPFDGFLDLFNASMSELGKFDLDNLYQLPLWREADRIADIGGGNGAIALELAGRFEDLSIDVLDLPHARAQAESRIGSHAAGRRVTFHDVDLRQAKPLSARFGPVFSAALLCNVLHHLTIEHCRTLFADIRLSLRAGGKIVVSEYFSDGTKETETFSLYLMISNRFGRLHSRSEIETLLHEEGFHITAGTGPQVSEILIAESPDC